MKKKNTNGLNINTRSFITAITVILILMIAAYVMTFIIPGGTYTRVPDQNGNLQIVQAVFIHLLTVVFPSGGGFSRPSSSWVPREILL